MYDGRAKARQYKSKFSAIHTRTVIDQLLNTEIPTRGLLGCCIY